ncbi:MAG: hypothetical protein MUE66_00980 [Acidimicrobiia bacterium]|nr:hypothetical protein [Acidimicrobiia bacterium]
MRQTAGALLAAGIVALAGCGGQTTATTTTAGTTTTTTAPATTAATADPAALGDEIGALYLAAYDDLIALLADRPASADAAAALASLKEQYIQQMVALGHRREALDDAGRAAVDARITAALGSLSTATYDAYQQAYADYSGDLEVTNLIASFNILGQYANFDLLREQAPDEAERLGIG